MSHASDPFDAVLEALAADTSTEFGAPGASVTVLRRIVGPFSSVQRVKVQTPAATTYAYIKVLKARGPGEEEQARVERLLRREYAATQALYAALEEDSQIGAVRPIALLVPFGALVTAEVPGRPLGELLAGARAVTDELTAIASRVGAWTRVYQRTVQSSGAVELAERRQYLDDRLRLLEGRVLSVSERQDTLRRFDALAADIGASSLPAVPIHADLTPMNIIVDGRGRVAVLDFTMAKTGTEHHDLSHVYFHLGLMGARRRGRRHLFRALQRAMLTGYSPALSAAAPLFQLMLLQHAVCHVALLAERRVPFLDRAYRWFLRRRWQSCVQISSEGSERQAA